ncbi:hypothetical protein [Nostoc sp. MG11]|nr:hypothetical protein [Nostoc sp. MG11]
MSDQIFNYDNFKKMADLWLDRNKRQQAQDFFQPLSEKILSSALSLT